MIDIWQICQEPYQFDTVEYFSLFSELLYVHLWEKNSVTIFTQATKNGKNMAIDKYARREKSYKSEIEHATDSINSNYTYSYTRGTQSYVKKLSKTLLNNTVARNLTATRVKKLLINPCRQKNNNHKQKMKHPVY